MSRHRRHSSSSKFYSQHPSSSPALPAASTLPSHDADDTIHDGSDDNATMTPFQVPMPLSRLAASLAEPRPWPIPGLLPPGLCLLMGKPLAGSFLLALQMALSISCGTPALDHFPTQAGGALYLGFNQALSTLLARAKMLLSDRPLPERLVCTDTWPTWNQGGLEELAGWLQSNPTTRVVIIDSLSCLRLSSSSTARKHALFHQLNALGHQHNVAIILLHSLARVSRRDPFASIPCSPILLEACTTLAVLDHDHHSTNATLHLAGNQITPLVLTLIQNDQDGSWQLDASAGDAPPQPSHSVNVHRAEQLPSHNDTFAVTVPLSIGFPGALDTLAESGNASATACPEPRDAPSLNSGEIPEDVVQ